MAKVQLPPGLGKGSVNEFMTNAAQAHRDIVDQVNGKLEFDANMATQTVTVNFTAANTDTAVSHKLNKVGVNYLPANKSVACNVFSGTRASTKNTIYLQCDQVAKVTLILF